MQIEGRKRPRKFISTDSRIPRQAPEKWPDARAAGETLPAFFERIWAPYLQHGLVAVQLRRLDAPLWKALHQHIVIYELSWPDHLAIPGLQPKRSNVIAKLDQGRWQELSDDEIIGALMERQRQHVKNALDKLRQRKLELRRKRAAIKKELKPPSTAD